MKTLKERGAKTVGDIATKCEDEKAKAEDLFEEVTPVDGGIADEFGFLTGTMTEKEFNETISQFDTFITRIRVGF